MCMKLISVFPFLRVFFLFFFHTFHTTQAASEDDETASDVRGWHDAHSPTHTHTPNYVLTYVIINEQFNLFSWEIILGKVY